MNKLLIILGCIVMTSWGLSYMILNLNLLVIGYSFIDYLFIIFKSISFWVFIIGIFMLFWVLKKS